MDSFSLSKDLLVSLPLLLLVGGTVVFLLYESFLSDKWPRWAFTEIVLLVALFASSYLSISGLYQPGQRVFHGLLYADGLSVFATGLILSATVFVVMLTQKSLADQNVEGSGEYYSLILMTTIGALIFASAAELITLFIGLETMSLALYCLCGSALSVRASSESALKYFLLGSFSSAVMLYGIVLLYGLTGTTVLPEIAGKIELMDGSMLIVAIGLILVGFLFKISAVPFHFWAPDVYQGAPTSVTAYMATVIKASAVIAFFRVLWGVFPEHSNVWLGALWTLAVITMSVGNLIALRQRSVKRMLAYSSVAHAGYMMVALLVDPVRNGGGGAVLFYLVAYTAMSIGAFGAVLAVASPHSSDLAGDELTRFNGLSQRSPVLAALMALFMLSLAGIPPGMAGLLGKFYVFNAAVKAGFVGIAIIGVLNSAVSAYYYLRVIVAMYFIDQKEEEKESRLVLDPAIAIALMTCAIGVVLLGIFPSALHDGASITAHSYMEPNAFEVTHEMMAQPRF